MNYQLLGRSYARGVWTGGLGYATGMWLSGNRTEWAIVSSMVATNIPILLDGDYDKPEVWVGQNLGALTVSAGLTFTIEMNRRGKAVWNVHPLIRN